MTIPQMQCEPATTPSCLLKCGGDIKAINKITKPDTVLYTII